MTGQYDCPPEERDARVHAVIDRHASRKGALLPILHDLMTEFGHIDDVVVPLVAERLNLSRADVHGVVTFYHDFRRKAPGRHIVKLCRAEACQSMGADALVAQAEARLGTKLHGTTADGRVTLDPIFCLGLCSAAPGALIDGRPVARLTPARLQRLLDEVAA